MKESMERALKELGETNHSFRLFDDLFPHSMQWAEDIERDTDYQEASGAWGIAHDCPVCGTLVTTGKAFCSDECKKAKVEQWKIKQELLHHEKVREQTLGLWEIDEEK